MILNKEQAIWLHRSIGQGPIDKAQVIIFGNEFGSARGHGNTEKCIEGFINEFKTRKLLKIGDGFNVLDIDSPPVSSTFLQFISRLLLAIKYKDERFFDSLTTEGWSYINNYIMNSLYRENSAIINLRPLPQPTENHWDYENINESNYKNLYNFKSKYHGHNKFREFRLKILKQAFDMGKNALILGAGDKYNKKAFFEEIYPNITFQQIVLNDIVEIYFSPNPKIIISNYYDNRSGVGLEGLKEIYNFVINNSLV
jgi:hypothetical protein